MDVFAFNSFSFILVTDNTGQSTLYNQDGLFYCQNALNYDCRALYDLGAPTTTWTCNTGVDNCEADDQLISRLIQGYDSEACYVTTSVTQLSFEGRTYFRTYLAKTRSGHESAEFACYAQ